MNTNKHKGFSIFTNENTEREENSVMVLWKGKHWNKMENLWRSWTCKMYKIEIKITWNITGLMPKQFQRIFACLLFLLLSKCKLIKTDKLTVRSWFYVFTELNSDAFFPVTLISAELRQTGWTCNYVFILLGTKAQVLHGWFCFAFKDFLLVFVKLRINFEL